jgi:hypothetical protein
MRRSSLSRKPILAVLAALALVLTPAASASAARTTPSATLAAVTPISIFGAWHCSNDACTWATVRTVTEFDSQNHWLVDRGNGQPSVNLVVLSFVNPLKLINQTTDAGNLNGVPRGMTTDIVNYFKSHNIQVMLSIGGITYTNDWDSALTQSGTLLGQRAAAVATQLGVGIEIDYEQNSNPNLVQLQNFITAYRAVHPYNAAGTDPTARLTLDTAAGDRWLIDINRKATADWLRTDTPVLDFANAMVPSKQPSVSSAESNWKEHIDGKPQYSPPVLPLAPAKFTGSLYIAEGSQVRPDCNNYANSITKGTADWLRSIAPNGAGTTSGMLGYMFWAAEKPSTRGVGTAPPNTCEGGVGVGATTLSMPLPLPALRQS